ncbi:MAG: hypothetical protein AMS25_12665 [Gemmatimonas sp. SM23_52]|nr:MAG: hypothetical protein AMS25_12665 [Gemmatimonas sp. SM23_52]
MAAASGARAQEQAAPAAGAQLAVAEAVITTGVQDRQPVDNVTTVPTDVGTVYCWTRITAAEGEIQLEHVWYKGDVEMARVSLRVAGSNWRTWSSKNIEQIWTGDWRVDIVGPDGTVLDSVSFTVG